MSDAERELSDVEYEIEKRLGRDWRGEYRTAAAALNAILRHETAAGRIMPHGPNWFSDEDRERLFKRAYGRSFVLQFAQCAMHARGAEMIRLVVNAVLAVDEQNERLEGMLLKRAELCPNPIFIMKTDDAGTLGLALKGR